MFVKTLRFCAPKRRDQIGERRHAYVHHTPKEQALYNLQTSMVTGLGPGARKPTAEQQQLRSMVTYVNTHWRKHRDMFGQGVRKAQQALFMPAEHDKILEHFRTTPGLLVAAGLDADDIGIAHVQSHAEIAANTGEPVDSDTVVQLYHMLYNLGVQPKVVCLAFND